VADLAPAAGAAATNLDPRPGQVEDHLPAACCPQCRQHPPGEKKNQRFVANWQQKITSQQA